MQTLLRLAFRIDALNRRLGIAVAWLTLGMVLVGSLNALSRHLLDKSSNAWIELQWYLFSLVFLLGAPWALRANAHVRVDVLYGRLSRRGRAWIDLVGGLLFLIPFCVFGIWISWPFVRDSWEVWEQSPDPGGLPRWPLKTAVPLAFALLLLQGLSEVVKRLAMLRGASDEAVGLEERREGAEEVAFGEGHGGGHV